MHKSTVWILFYFILLSSYTVFSYSLTDPNLVLTGWQPYWNFQQWMWQTFFSNHQLLTSVFVVLVILLCSGWAGLVSSLPKKFSLKQLVMVCGVLAFPLFFSYNALSHDVFNYIFNAKMVVVYKQNPHQHVALNFPHDDWIRFMHNTHTPAPYGYGWTVFSLIPFLLGFGKFTLTWVIFRGVNVVAIPLLVIVLLQLAKVLKKPFVLKDVALFLFSPLFLIEMISNSHNDLWMLIPAVASLWLIFQLETKKVFWSIFFSLLLLLISISMKLATLTLLPVWMSGLWLLLEKAKTFFAVPKKISKYLTFITRIVQENLGFLASVLLFIPLLTSRSQQFQPWYLTWSLIWLPFIKVKWWRTWLVALSLSSLLRYVPWLLAGEFSSTIVFQQQAVTWIGGIVGCVVLMIGQQMLHKNNKNGSTRLTH